MGWRMDDLLPYFYVDWTDSPFYRQVSDAVIASSRLCQTQGTAVVLGSGAGRLLIDLAGEFKHSLGVDLSLPALLFAKTLLMGGEAEFSLERADWTRVKIHGAAKPPANISLTVADAVCLPFANGSLVPTSIFASSLSKARI